MCRIEERVYVGPDGRERVFEGRYPCHSARGNQLCANVKTTRTRYVNPPPISRDDASSPGSNNPPTPTGTYILQERRPSGTTRRPSLKERAIRPEIIINFGSRKDKEKKYPSSKSYKRSSLASVGSNDFAIESPGSEGSFTVRTGLQDDPKISQGHGAYSARPNLSSQGHRHTSSSSSFTSSQTPSLVATSEPESPSMRQLPRYPPTIVHNPPADESSGVPKASSKVGPGIAGARSGNYRTTIVAPMASSSRESVGPTTVSPSVNPFDYQDRSASSFTGSSLEGAPEITARGAYRDRARQLNADAEKKKRQEEADRDLAKRMQMEEERKAATKVEETKQVRFELDRAKARAQERAQQKFAQSEKDRADEREEARLRKREKTAAEERERLNEEARRREQETKKETVKPREKRDSRPPLSGTTKHHGRRASISQAELAERDRLLASEQAHMALEREAADQQERDERAALLLQQQQTREYYNPRGGEGFIVRNENSTVGRRNSVTGRRPSVVVQNAPPMNSGVPAQQPTYAMRPSSSSQRNPPPFLPPRAVPQTYSRPPSARHPSYHQDNSFSHSPGRVSNTSQENPFAQQPARVSNSSYENPFAAHSSARHATATTSYDPWDSRDMQDALPQPMHAGHPSEDGRHKLRRRGEEGLEYPIGGDKNRHHGARQATRNMGKVTGYEDDYEDDNSDDAADAAAYVSRSGLGKAPRKRFN